MNKECEIVKDLLPNYVENQISNVSKEFVENHIKECADCQDMLNYIKRKRN